MLPLLTPPPEGGRALSWAARRGWWGWPWSRRAPSRGSEPLARRVKALVWFGNSREFLLEIRRPTWDLKDDRRQVLTRYVGGWVICIPAGPHTGCGRLNLRPAGSHTGCGRLNLLLEAQVPPQVQGQDELSVGVTAGDGTLSGSRSEGGR